MLSVISERDDTASYFERKYFHILDNDYASNVKIDANNELMTNKINELILAIKTGFTDISKDLEERSDLKTNMQYLLESTLS